MMTAGRQSARSSDRLRRQPTFGVWPVACAPRKPADLVKCAHSGEHLENRGTTDDSQLPPITRAHDVDQLLFAHRPEGDDYCANAKLVEDAGKAQVARQQGRWQLRRVRHPWVVIDEPDGGEAVFGMALHDLGQFDADMSCAHNQHAVMHETTPSTASDEPVAQEPRDQQPDEEHNEALP